MAGEKCYLYNASQEEAQTLEVGLIVQSAKDSLKIVAQTEAVKDSVTEPEHTADIYSIVLSRLDDDQAQDIVPIHLEGKSDVADAMVIASGRSQRHVGAMADKIARDLKDAGVKQVSVEGLPACDWVLIDAGDVIVHLFRPEVRKFYNLERIWAPELFDEEAGDTAFEPSTDAMTVTGEDES